MKNKLINFGLIMLSLIFSVIVISIAPGPLAVAAAVLAIGGLLLSPAFRYRLMALNNVGATAIDRSGEKTRTLKYTSASAVGLGDVIVVNGQVVIACGAYGANVEGVYIFRGRVEFPKEASLAIAPGEKCYWVAGNGNVNKTSAGNTEVGICVENALTTDSVVLVELGENR